MLEIRKIAVGHELVFIGPVTSLNGVYLGPFWYYFNLPAFVLGQGNPAALVYWQIIFFHLVVIFFWWLFRKKQPAFAFFAALFFLFSSRLFQATSYSFNANTAPAFVILFIVLLFYTLQNKKPWFVFLLGLLSGLTLQIEAAFGILLMPLAIFWLYRFKVKKIRLLLLGFIITLLPQILFEIKHHFIMTGVFLTEFSGRGDILGRKLSLLVKLSDRFAHYYGSLPSAFPLGQLSATIFICILFLYLSFAKKSLLFKINLSLLAISFIAYLIYPNRLKDWWSINFVIPYIFIFATALGSLWQSKKLIKFTVLAIILYSFINGLIFFQTKFQEKLTQRSNDPALLQNQLDVIDWIYKSAQGKGFKVYDYTPAIYDYHYQYLFWWSGFKRYGYQPAQITYQDNVPEYIEDNKRYWQAKKDLTSDSPVFLIIENDDNRPEAQLAWLDHFKDLCSISKIQFPSDITIERRLPCAILKQ